MPALWREVADRIWIRRCESLDQTIGVIGGADGLVVIDTRAHHRAADELLDDLKQLPGPVVAAVNTHGHWDHAFGNARFATTPIWGHIRSAPMITERGEETRAPGRSTWTPSCENRRSRSIQPARRWRATRELSE